MVELVTADKSAIQNNPLVFIQGSGMLLPEFETNCCWQNGWRHVFPFL
jgi:hypothetical protein